MKIEIKPFREPRIITALENATDIENVGVPEPFILYRNPALSKEIVDVLIIPFDSVDMNKKGLLKYGKKLKVRLEHSFVASFYNESQDKAYLSDLHSGENAWGGSSWTGEMSVKPYVYLVNVTICNHKIVFILAHKDVTQIAGREISSAGKTFVTHNNRFPYPVNANWVGLEGSWEHYQAVRSGKSFVSPNLYENFPCKITIDDADYSVVAVSDGYTQKRMIHTGANNPPLFESIANSVTSSFNVHDTVAEFLVKCNQAGLFPRGYIRQAPVQLPVLEEEEIVYEPKRGGKKTKAASESTDVKALKKLVSDLESALEISENGLERENERNKELRRENKLLKSRLEQTTVCYLRICENIRDKYVDGHLYVNLSISDALGRLSVAKRVKEAISKGEVVPDVLVKVFGNQKQKQSFELYGMIGGVIYLEVRTGDNEELLPLHKVLNVPELAEWLEEFINTTDYEEETKNMMQDEVKKVINFIDELYKYQEKAAYSTIAIGKLFSLRNDED